MAKPLFSLLLAGILAGIALVPATAQVATVTAGSQISALSPINHASSEGAYETIYLQNSINQAGAITRLAFEKSDGTELTPLSGVILYLKTTTATEFQSGALDTLGYQRVYAGNFPNATTSGYQEVQLQRPFSYANTAGQHLSVLVLRRGGNVQATIGPRARFLYGVTTAPLRIACRRYTGTLPVTSATMLTATNVLCNIRLTFNTPQATAAARRLVLALYPNPATSTLQVELPRPNQAAQVQIIDFLGRVVGAEQRLAASTTGVGQLSVATLPAGSYWLRLRQDGEVRVQPFVKE
ncbi:T9SS type A sorting domain-containing protein [Hymenobacter puniceus]|uniref:T9SS type A sorting domain-containing protein n=1 Tax=Hymenobacter sp. BT190 TaxID=2763505 RepID=UPI00165104F4|nr:T9SS type A sorting domain-containing protein [Hymenobacter sp. BT190]MBC6698999.1 T9SS type A sorting domain-containing protein [Hymenobacter sp. BT190]